MKKPVTIILGIIGVLFVLAIMTPWLISLNQYKTMIQEKAFEATGRNITINGDVRFGILPSPYARLTDVVVSNPEGTLSKEFAAVKALDVGVALAPLFSKKVQITHITVSEPAITLEVLEDGSNNWTFTPQKTAGQQTAQDASSPMAKDAFSIDDLTIEKGFIRYVNVAGKSQQTVGPIDARFKIESLQGPISGIGTATAMEKLPLRFDVTIDTLPSDENKTIPFTLSIGVLNNAGTADLKGTVNTGDDMTARVETSVVIADLEKILAALNEKNQTPALPDYLKGKTTMTGLLNWKDQRASIDNLMLKAGSTEVLGSLAVTTKDTMSVVLDLNRVALPPETAQKSAAPASSKAAAPLAKTLSDAFAQAIALLDTALPKADMNIVVTASQLPLPNQPTLRDVRLAASITDKGVTLQNVETKLPGNTHIKLRGTLPARADGKIEHAAIQADVTSDNISEATGKAASAEKMPVNLQAAIALTRQQLRINPLTLHQKGQTVQGDITYNPKAEDALSVAIKGSALNIDSFMGGDTKTAANTNAKTAPATSSASSDPLAMLQGLKARLAVDLGSATFQGKIAKDIKVQAVASDKGVAIQTARIGDLGGMVIDANGQIARLSPLGGATIQAQAKTANLSTTLKALGNADAANLGASAFNATIKGGADSLDVALNGTIDQGKVDIKGNARNVNTSPAFNGSIDISHPETATILRNFAKMTPKINLGAFALRSDVAYGADTLKADKLLVKLGSAGTLQGHIIVEPAQGGRKIDADLRADKLALAALMGDDTKTDAALVDVRNPDATQTEWSREAINLEALRGLNGKANVEIGELLYKKFIIRDMKTTLLFANNTINLDRFSGGMFDAGTFNIKGQLAPGAQGQAHRGDFALTINKTDAVKLFAALGSKPLNKGVVDVNQTLTFNGASPYQLVSSLHGDGQFKMTDVIVNGLDLDALADRLDRPNSLSDFAAIIKQASAGGETVIGNLDVPVTIRNGIVNMQDTVIKTQKTQMMMKGTVQLPAKQVDMTGQITFVEQRNLPPLTLFIKGPMNNPQKNFDTRGFTNFYAQKATEKLQDKLETKIQDGLGKLLGVPKTETPAPATTAPATTAPAAAPDAVAPVTAPTTPAAPIAPSTAPVPSKKQQRDDALKQLGNDVLNNLLGGGRQ